MCDIKNCEKDLNGLSALEPVKSIALDDISYSFACKSDWYDLVEEFKVFVKAHVFRVLIQAPDDVQTYEKHVLLFLQHQIHY